jgi:hypothetical protein
LPKKKIRPHYKRTKSIPIEPTPEVIRPAAPPWKFDRQVAMEVIGLLFMPLIAFWAMRFIPINQNQYLDPYVYTGYIHDFKDLIARYGLTYYSVRFGMIIPAQAFAHLFGPVGGYFAFRYALALSAGMSLYYMVKLQFSQPIAAMTVIGLLTSPYFARALLWDYPDAAGVPFLVAAICVFLLQERPSLWRDMLAGAFAAMAVNSNFFEVALVGLFGFVWLLFSVLFRHPLKDLTKRVAGVALGGFIVCFLGCVYYWHAFGRPTNIFYPTLGMAYSQAKGGAKQWRTSGVSWIAMQIQVLMPIFLAVCCLLVSRWRRMMFTSWVVVSFGLAVTAFYYVEQFLLASNVLQFFYYFSYFMPAVFLMLAYLWQTLWEGTRRRSPEFITLGLTALLTQWVLSMRGWALPNLTIPQWLALGSVTAAVVFLSSREWRIPRLQVNLAWLALVLVTGFFSAGLSNYGGMMRTASSAKNVEMDVYRVALQFMQVVPKMAERPGGIMFWYNNRVGNSINSIQSTYLWGYSKINASPPEDPGLPHLGELQLKLLNDPQVRFLGLLCESEEELSQGLAALTKKAIEFKTADYRVLASGDYRIYYQIVELMHSPGAVAH